MMMIGCVLKTAKTRQQLTTGLLDVVSTGVVKNSRISIFLKEGIELSSDDSTFAVVSLNKLTIGSSIEDVLHYTFIFKKYPKIKIMARIAKNDVVVFAPLPISKECADCLFTFSNQLQLFKIDV